MANPNIINEICEENNVIPADDLLIDFLKHNDELIERFVFVYDGLLKDMIIDEFRDKFEAFVKYKAWCNREK